MKSRSLKKKSEIYEKQFAKSHPFYQSDISEISEMWRTSGMYPAIITAVEGGFVMGFNAAQNRVRKKTAKNDHPKQSVRDEISLLFGEDIAKEIVQLDSDALDRCITFLKLETDMLCDKTTFNEVAAVALLLKPEEAALMTAMLKKLKEKKEALER